MRTVLRNRHRPRQIGGVVSLTRVRDRMGENEDRFAVSWHTTGGDIRWLSSTMTAENADAAAEVLANFAGAVLRR
jgi:hypothetical protein